jgi:predicted transcriptional regulator
MAIYNLIDNISYIPYYIKLLRFHNVNLYEMAVLSAVSNLSGINTYEHTIFLKLRNSLLRTTIKKHIQHLINKGLLYREGKLIYLTPEGSQLIGEIGDKLIEYAVIDRVRLKKMRYSAPFGDKAE